MPYPDASNFQSSAAGSAWFKQLAGGDGSNGEIVSTQGRTFVERLQQALRDGLGSGPNATYGGGSVSASDVAVDGKWGPITNRALYAVLSVDFPDPAALASVQADETNQAVGPVSLKYALAEAYNLDPSAVYVAPNTVPPSWNNPAPVPEPSAPAEPVTMPDPGTAPLPSASGGGGLLRTLGIVAGVGLVGAAVVVAKRKRRTA